MFTRLVFTALIGACLGVATATPAQAQRSGHSSRFGSFPPGAGVFDHPGYSGEIGPVYYVGPPHTHVHRVGPYFWEGFNRPLRGPAHQWDRDPWQHQYERRRTGPIPPWHR